MANVIDLTDDGAEHDLLTGTAMAGLLGGQYLADSPLETYLDDGEQPRYLLRNKQSGLEIIDGGGRQAVQPSDDFRALALVTDLRTLVVVGRRAGDEKHSLRHADVVEASMENSGFRETTLVVDTLDGESWRFPCRGDVSEVARYVDDAAQAWANATRLLDDVKAQVEQAEQYVADGHHVEAANEIDGVDEAIETARTRIREVGERRFDEIQGRVRTLKPAVESLRRRIAAVHGGTDHATAQRAWDDGEYERAAGAYDTAIEAYERALSKNGDNPTDEALRSRASAAVREREILRVGPRIDADATRREARATSDSEEAAEIWTVALDSYRDMLGLNWPAEGNSFLVDRELIREQTTAVADDAIEDHAEAGEAWLTSGDELAVDGREQQAKQVYERAREQFRRAMELAREVRPGRTDELEEQLAAVDERLDGNYPTEVPDDGPLSVEELKSEAESIGEAESSGGADGERSVLNRIREQKQATQDDARDETVGGTSVTTAVDGADHTAAGRLDDTATETPGEKGTTPTGNSGTPETDGDSASVESPPQDRSDAVEEATQTDDGSESRESDSGSAPDPGLGASTLVAKLRKLTDEEFTDLVAAVWDAKGYSTTVFTATTKAVYDIVALQEEPTERLLIWTVHRPDGGALGSTVVKRCATGRDSSQRSDGATLVTSGTLTDPARARAGELDVSVVDAVELAALLRTHGLESQVDSR